MRRTKQTFRKEVNGKGYSDAVNSLFDLKTKFAKSLKIWQIFLIKKSGNLYSPAIYKDFS